MDSVIMSMTRNLGTLGPDYRETWRDSLTSPSGQHLNVRVPTTDPTLDTYVNNENTRNALAEAYRKLVEADAMIRAVRGHLSSRREAFDPKERHQAGSNSLSEHDMAEMESRSRAKPSRKWERAS